MSIDTVGDFLTIIRNGVKASKSSVRAPYSRLKHEIAEILKHEGFVRDFSLEEDGDNKKYIQVSLKYVDGESVIHKITRVSRPGLRVYRGNKTLQSIIGGLGVAIVTTNRGVMTDKKARELVLGGEVICAVW